MDLERGLSGAFETIREIATGGQRTEELRKDVFNDKWDNIEVDTCIAFDTDKWETGIDPGDGHFVIVEQYEDREDAESGHKSWVEKMKQNPSRELRDLDLWGIGI